MAAATRLVPTGRAALLIAAAGPVALLIAAAAPRVWSATPALATLVLLAIAIDGWLAGGLGKVALSAPGDLEVGDAGELALSAQFASRHAARAEAAVSADPRLVPAGRAALPLAPRDGEWRGALAVNPARRGTARLDSVSLRWEGPLGLGARTAVRPLATEVRIWPNLGAVRSGAIQRYLRQADFGLLARRLRGEGAQFEALSEYEPGMDRRRIDWKASARHARLYAKEYEAERNNQIVFAFDCGAAMCQPVGGLARLDRAVSAALTSAYVALKGGDRVALFGFAARPELLTPFVTLPRDFNRLQQAAAALDYSAAEPNFTLALATLSSRLARRSLVVVFSDFADPTSAELMIESIGRLVQRHLVLFVSFNDDELEAIAAAAPAGLDPLAMAVGASTLLRQRTLVLSRLRQLGVEVISAPHQAVSLRLLDAYLALKRRGAIG